MQLAGEGRCDVDKQAVWIPRRARLCKERQRFMKPSLARDFYTVSEMADLLRIRPGTVRNRLWRCAHSLPPSAVIRRRRLFPVSGYDAWKQP